ncbi:MAG: helix-turn-helix domain-containing protein, partial [Oscillospiraceae bacterium]
MLSQDFYLKNRLIIIQLARDFLIAQAGDQTHTIAYYTQLFSVSRGTVQAGMQYLIDQKAFETQFNGHLGTYLVR